MDDETIAGESTGSGAGIQVIARAAKVLRALERRPDGLSLAEIAREVGLARSTVQRIVAALAAEEFVTEAQPGRGVRIGAGLARIAASLGSNIAEILRPHLHALCEEVGETVDLSVLSGGSAIFVAQVPGRQRLVAVSAVGARFPLHCTANGKAILSCFSKQDAVALIDKSSRRASCVHYRRSRTSASRDRNDTPHAPRLRYGRPYRWHQRRRRRYARRLRPADRHLDTCALATICERAGLALAGARRLS